MWFSDEPTGRLALVFELMEMNMYDAIKGNKSSIKWSLL
jgi:hydroxyethylthiazole kinase-like sugar kinase family protein